MSRRHPCGFCGERGGGGAGRDRLYPNAEIESVLAAWHPSAAAVQAPVHADCLRRVGLGRRPDATWWRSRAYLLPLLARVDERIETLTRGMPHGMPGRWNPVTMADVAAKLIAAEFAFVDPSTPLCAETLERFGRFRMTAIHAPPDASDEEILFR
jgi:hypothetical protein